MTTYNGVNALSGASTDEPKLDPSGKANDELWTFALTAALAGGDLINMQKIPAGCYLSELKLDTPQLDTGGTPAIAFDVCLVGATGTIFLKNVATAQGATGGVADLGSSTAQGGSVGYSSTSQQQLMIKVRTGPQVGATSGTIALLARYTPNP